MIRNYIIVAFRNMLKNKSYIAINTLGLGISLACCIGAYLLLAYNIEFDSFYKKDAVKDIFKFHTFFHDKSGNKYQDIYSPIALGPQAANSIAGIEKYVRFIRQGGTALYGENVFNENFAFVDSTFFDIFDFPLVTGNHSLLKDLNSIFLTEEMAKKYFGDENPIGKSLELYFNGDKQILATVSGVIKEVPNNNTFTFNFLMRIEHFMTINQLTNETWDSWRNPSTFVQLSSPKLAGPMSDLFNPFIERRNEVKLDEVVTSYELRPFLYYQTGDEIHARFVNMRIPFSTIIIFITLAGLILLIACFNLTNTSIAITSKRLKEIGIKKAVGAERRQIVYQFLFETTLIITLSLLMGLLISLFLVPYLASLLNLNYGLEDMNGLNLFITAVILIFLTSLLAGTYPAIFNSRFNPAVLIQGSVKINGTNGFTRTLIAMQFALSIIMLIAGVIFIRNAKFQENIDFGYNKDNVINIQINGEKEYEVMKNALSNNPNILSISASSHHISANSFRNPITIDDNDFESRIIGVGHNYFETMGIALVEGRAYNENITTDEEKSIIVNKKFLQNSSLTDPIGKEVIYQGDKKTIIGVVENHIDNLFRAKEPEPFVYPLVSPAEYGYMSVKILDTELAKTRDDIESVWKANFPTRPFFSNFQDDFALSGVRNVNESIKEIFLFLTILGALLSISGVFALASLNIVKRTKEIGIRKVLGATEGNIIGLMNREFVWVLSASVVLGSTGGFFLTSLLLDQIYAYHINVGLPPVLLSAILIFAIGITTTSATIFKAAVSDPVETLRKE